MHADALPKSIWSAADTFSHATAAVVALSTAANHAAGAIAFASLDTSIHGDAISVWTSMCIHVAIATALKRIGRSDIEIVFHGAGERCSAQGSRQKNSLELHVANKMKE